MNKMMIRAALVAAAFIVSIPLGLAAQEPGAVPDQGYYAYSYARLSYVNGDVFVQRSADQGFEKGEINLALVQGDTLGTQRGQAEIHFGQRNYLRLGENTKVEFATLPTEGDQRIGIHLTEGTVYVRVSALLKDKGFEIHTPDASFYVLEAGLYRFDVRPDGTTRAYASEGSLEAAAEAGSVVVETHEAVTASDGRLLGDPEYASSGADAFDQWNGNRDSLLMARSDRQYLPSEMSEYEEELDDNGHWVYEQPYGNVWVPDVSYYDDWRPYSYGRWSWYNLIGWTWIPSEPWGWSVYHYGRWNWRFGLGWYWIPRSHWGPAWVDWWWDGDYFGWCPLTWYDRPAYLFRDRFYDRWNDRYFSAHNRAMTVVRREHLQDPDVGRRHLGTADLDRIGRVELRHQQPGIRPTVDNARPQAIAARRALQDRPGSRTEVRALAPSRSVSSSSLRQGSANGSIRSRDRSGSVVGGGRDAVARPTIRGDNANTTGVRAIRSYPSRRDAGGGRSAVSPDRRGAVAAPANRNDAGGSRAGEARSIRPQGQARGAASTGRGESVKSYPANRSGSSSKPSSSGPTSGTVKSGPVRSPNASTGRSQSRTYAPRDTASRTSPRLSSPSISEVRPSASISRSSTSGRSASGSYGRSTSSRTPSSVQPRSSYSAPSRSGSFSGSSRPGSSYSSPSRSYGSSSRSYSAPRSSGSSSGRSYSSPRSSGSSSGRSYSSPRSNGSSAGRSYSAPRSSGRSSSVSVRSSSSGRSSSSSRSSGSSSRSSGSSSRSGGARRR